MKQSIQALLLAIFFAHTLGAQPGLADLDGFATCTSTCTGTLGENIYPNGDFGSGIPNMVQTDPGLAPGYIYQVNPPPNDGYYSISNNTTPWGWFAANVWIDIEDNGPEPYGYMMVVNASYPPGLFFQNTVQVCENTLYEFSVDVVNLIESSQPQLIRPNLSFLIDGIAYCETGNIPPDEQWHTVRFSFTTAPGQTSVVLAMRNNAPGGNGNDLAIDNISFRACGPDIQTASTVSFCKDSPVLLEAQLLNMPFSVAAYQWQMLVNGVWEDIPGANSTQWLVQNPGDGDQFRMLSASALSNLSLSNCRVVSEVIRLQQLPELVLQTQALEALCFGQTSGSVLAQSLSGLAPFSFAWNTGATTDTVTALGAGSYSVTITDALGCTGTGATMVSEPSPIASEIAFQTVSCFGGADGWAAAMASGGISPYQFDWGNGDSMPLLQNLQAGLYQLTISDANGCTHTSTVNISAPQPLLAEVQANAVFCFGGNNASAQATALGGTVPYSFLWSQGQTTAQVSGLLAGVFAVTVTDANGCTDLVSGMVTEPTVLTASIGASDVACYAGNDGNAFVSPTGGISPYTFVWSSGQTNAQIANLSAGQYTVTITDANACSTIETVTLTEPPALGSAASASPVLCFGGGDGAVTVEVQGGQMPYAYSWSNGQTTALQNGLIAGLYEVTVTDAHACTTTALANVLQPDLLVVQTIVNPVSCAGAADGMLSAQSSGGVGPYTFWWSNGQNGQSASDLIAGTYTLTATDAQGCTSIATTEVTEPSPLQSTLQQQDATCFGHADGMATIGMNGGTPPYTYVWNTGQTTSTISQVSAGNYQVTTVDAQGCTLTASVSLGQPTALSGNMQTQEPDCFGHSTGVVSAIALGGTPPYTFLWQTGETSSQLNDVPAGLYALNITDAHQCQLAQQILLSQPAPLVVEPLALPVSCPEVADGSLQATAQGGVGPYQFSWSNGQSGPMIDALAMGVYAVSVIDAHGCTASAQDEIQEELIPTLDLGLDQTLDLGQELVLTALTNLPSNEILDYTWSGAGGELQCPDCFRFQFLPLESACQRVLVRTIKGCQASDEVCFTLVPRRKIYVPNVFTPDDNGENDFFTIYSDASVLHIRYLKIFSRWGEQLFIAENIRTNDEPAGWSGIYRGKPMNPGVFVWVAELEFIDGQVLILKGDVTLLR